MKEEKDPCELTEDDLRAAIVDLKNYVDVTEEDLMTIYAAAIRHARMRLAPPIPVSSVMTKKVVTVAPDADIHDAARLLAENKVSGLPVVDDHYHVLGMIVESDILTALGLDTGHTFRDIVHHIQGILRPHRNENLKVRDVMTAPALTVRPETEVRVAAQTLHQRQIKRLPVVDSDGKLLGIVSRADLVRILGEP